MAEMDLEGLVRAASTGDRDAFGRLTARFQDAAFSICYGRLGQRELARDAAQDAFIDAYLHLTQLREPRAFAGWFRRVLYKHCDRRVRKRRPDTHALEQHAQAQATAVPDAERALLAAERADWLHQAIAALPEHERVTIALYYLAGQTLDEIGALLEVEPNAIKQRLHSARRRLAEKSEDTMDQHMQTLRPSQTTAFSDRVALFLAIRAGDEAGVRALLARDPTLHEAVETWDARGFFPERDVPVATQATPLIRAAETGELGIVRALLDAGAAVEGGCACNLRETPLWAAVVTGRREVAAELLARGADPGRRARSGIACLHAAAIRGDRALVELLLAHGADRDQRDGSGRRALDWAQLKGHAQLLDLLGAEASPASTPTSVKPEPGEPFATGIKAIDLFVPLSRGSLVLVDGGAGVGRNVLLAELAERARREGTESVWALWQREPWSERELHTLLHETHIGAHVHVLSHEGALAAPARELPARALSLCDALLARGARHVQLTLFEQPGVRAAIEALLPALGRRPDGTSVTTFVVPPWQTAGDGPLALAPPLDACIAFDPKLASALCFPAVDPLRSRSRLLEGAKATDEHAACADRARALLLAAQQAGERAESDVAVERSQRLRAYLTQPFHVAEAFSGRPGVSVELGTLLRDVRAILDGQADAVAVEAIAYRGTLAL
jgi:RNA polymerase sigma factor (sigma-70 family)